MRIRHALVLAVAGLAFISHSPLTATESPVAQYAIQDLGDFGPDTYAFVAGINRHGDVVGWVQSLTDYSHVRAWRRLHDAAAPEILRCCRSWAMSINDAGVIVGFEASPDGMTTAFRYSDADGFTEIEALRGFQAAPAAINNAGDVAGVYLPSPEIGPRAFRVTGTTLEDLGVFRSGAASWGLGMNDGGQVTGYAYGSGWSFRMAFRSTPGAGLENLGTLGGSDSEGNAINARGQVVGTAVTGGVFPRFHAFRYTDGAGMLDLAPHLVASNGLGLNGAGDAVGRALFGPDEYAPDRDLYHAFLYTDAAGIIDLNDVLDPASGWILNAGTVINDAGQIAGYGELNGRRKAFKLIKDIEPPSITAAVPSQSVLWPPDGRMVPVSFTVTATDNLDPQPVCGIASISSNEVDGREQFAITGPFSATFAATRDGQGTGRVYTTTISCRDRSGNTALQRVFVTVPHHQ